MEREGKALRRACNPSNVRLLRDHHCQSKRAGMCSKIMAAGAGPLVHEKQRKKKMLSKNCLGERYDKKAKYK